MNNCSQVAHNILMNEHIWYRYRFIIAIIIGFFIGIMFHSPSVLGSSCIVSMLSSIVVYYGIEYYAKQSIDNNDIKDLLEKCQSMSSVNITSKLNAVNSVLRKDTQRIMENFSGIALEKASHEKNCNQSNYDFVNNEIINKNKITNTCSSSMLNENNAYAPSTTSNEVMYEGFRNPYANINSNYEVLNNDPVPSPPAQVSPSACLSCGIDKCSPVCSGADENPCNLQLSTPGPQWQVQSAQAVQNRLNNGKFVPNRCPL
mgnify:CR=1 FL=1